MVERRAAGITPVRPPKPGGGGALAAVPGAGQLGVHRADLRPPQLAVQRPAQPLDDAFKATPLVAVVELARRAQGDRLRGRFVDVTLCIDRHIRRQADATHCASASGMPPFVRQARLQPVSGLAGQGRLSG